MPKVKPKRKVPTIDMTAMVDVAFLLLTFFILTTKFRPNEIAPTDQPSAVTTDTTFKANHEARITIAKDGRVLFGVKDRKVRKGMIERISNTFQFSDQLTEEGVNNFVNSEEFAVPIGEVAKWLSLEGEEFKDFEHKGIPVNTKRGNVNELREWIMAARRAAIAERIPLQFSLKADRDTPQPEYEKVLYTLRDVDLNKIYMVTKLEMDQGGGAKGASGENP